MLQIPSFFSIVSRTHRRASKSFRGDLILNTGIVRKQTMARLAGTFAALFLLLAAVSEAATYNVGGSTGWALPATPSFYTDWASRQTFAVGDILAFNFQTGTHTVVRVSTKAAFDGCSSASPVSVITQGPARITLNATGDYHFFCGIPGHCEAGQKLSVSVGVSPSGAPTPTSPATPTAPNASPATPTTPDTSSPGPSGSTTPEAPPPQNSASSLSSAFSLLLVSAAMALFH